MLKDNAWHIQKSNKTVSSIRSSSGYHVIQNMISAGSLSLFKPMESWSKIDLGGGCNASGIPPHPGDVPRTCRPGCERIRLRNIERFYAIILSTSSFTPIFSPPSTITSLSSIPCSLMEMEGGEGGKANLLTLNRRGGVAARIKLRGRVPTAERRRRYRRNDHFPRGLTSDFVAPDLRPVPVRRTFMCAIDRL